VIVERYAAGGDAWHLTGNDPRGELLRRLIRHVADHRGVDLVHAHGTGTIAHDPVELAAFETALQDLPPSSGAHPPCLYSHKGALGHSLGAAGLVGVVLSRRAHLCGVVPGNVRTTAPLPVTRLVVSSCPEARTIGRSLTTAAGFGGATAVVSLVSR
jgi:3-oxoacyl-(acyl-carrier-protein) synthase